MNTHPLETFTRQVGAAVTRRTSLLTLGGAVLTAAAAHPDVSAARKKSGNTCKRKSTERCNRNKTQCASSVTTFCNGDASCIAKLTPCCDECFSNAFLVCFSSKE